MYTRPSPTTWHAWPALSDMYGLRALSDDERAQNGLTLAERKTPTCAYVWSERHNGIALFKRASDEGAAMESIAALLAAEAGIQFPRTLARTVPDELLQDTDLDHYCSAFVVSPVLGASPKILATYDRNLSPIDRAAISKHIATMLPFALFTTNEDYSGVNIVVADAEKRSGTSGPTPPLVYAIDFEELALHKINDYGSEKHILTTAFAIMAHYRLPFDIEAAHASASAIRAISKSVLCDVIHHAHKNFPQTIGKRPRAPSPPKIVARLKQNAENLGLWIQRETLSEWSQPFSIKRAPG